MGRLFSGLFSSFLSGSFFSRFLSRSFFSSFLNRSLFDDFLNRSLFDDFLSGSLFDSFLSGSFFDDFLSRSLFLGLEDVRQVFFVIEKSTDGKADAFLVVVDVGDLAVDDLALLQDIVRFLDALVGDLGNVDEAVDAGDDVGECTERGHADDGSVDNVADFIGLGENDPGVVFVFLVTKRDALVLEGFDVNFDRVAAASYLQI